MSTSARQLLFAIPIGMQAVGSFGRIQKFLLLEESSTLLATNSSDDPEKAGIREKSPETGSEVPSEDVQVAPAGIVNGGAPRLEVTRPPTISLRDVSFARGSFTAITGTIGCGKSTLLRRLLSEIPGIQDISEGSSHGMAYCGQTPWIHDGTIRDNIIGESIIDVSWYRDVVHSCELDFDLSRMPEGDATVVGSGGLRLSGGQRQRIVRIISKFISTWY